MLPFSRAQRHAVPSAGLGGRVDLPSLLVGQLFLISLTFVPFSLDNWSDKCARNEKEGVDLHRCCGRAKKIPGREGWGFCESGQLYSYYSQLEAESQTEGDTVAEAACMAEQIPLRTEVERHLQGNVEFVFNTNLGIETDTEIVIIVFASI